jgi:hypothetical protein
MIKPYHSLYKTFIKNKSIKNDSDFITYILYNDKKIEMTTTELIDSIHKEELDDIIIMISPIHTFNSVFNEYIGWSSCSFEFVFLEKEKKYAVKYTIPVVKWIYKDQYKLELESSLLLSHNYKTITCYCYFNNKKYIYKNANRPDNEITNQYLHKQKPSNFINLVHEISNVEYIYSYMGYTVNDIDSTYDKTYIPQIINIMVELGRLGFCRTDNKAANFTYIYHYEKKDIVIKNSVLKSHYEWCLIDVDNLYYYTDELLETSKLLFIIKCLIKLNNKHIFNSLLTEFLIYLYEQTDYDNYKKQALNNNFNKNLLTSKNKKNKCYIYDRYTPEIAYCCFVFIHHYDDFIDKLTQFNNINAFIKSDIEYPNSDIVSMINIMLNNNVSDCLNLLLE